MNRKLFLLPLLVLVLSACSLYKINSDETSLDFYEPKSPSSQILFLENADSQKYEVIGTVVVNTERRTAKDVIIAKAKREAARLGGNAITNLREEPPEHKSRFLRNAYIRTNYRVDVLNLADTPAAK